jgi:hypothetical protein
MPDLPLASARARRSIPALGFLNDSGVTMKIIMNAMTLAFLFMLCADTSYACTCIGPGSAKQGLAKAQAVFSGRATKANGYEYEFEVERIWKGKIKKSRIIVGATAPNTSCEIELIEGEQYIVFADIDKERDVIIFYPQICNYTSLLSQAGNTIKELGKGRLIRSRRDNNHGKKVTLTGKPHNSLNRTRN